MKLRRILHAADIHLDSPMLRLEEYEGAPVEQIRSATRSALAKMVDLAIGESVDLVVIAGDLYDGDWNEFSTGLYFVRESTRLIRHGIPLVVIRGNHDAANLMTQSLPLPLNPDGTSIMLDHAQVDRRIFEKLGVVIHGRSFATRAVTEDLSLAYPSPIQGMFNLGLLHTCLTGADGHANYSPCNPKQLQDKGYDYWALGHIHDRRECHQSGETPIVFSGNIQGRNIREVGAKGCVIVTIGDNNDLTTRFEPLDVVRWQSFDHDASQDESRDDLINAFADWLPNQLQLAENRSLAVRVNVTGGTQLSNQYHRSSDLLVNELRSIAIQHSGGQVWLENLKVRTKPSSSPTIESALDETEGDDARHAISHVINALRSDESAQASLIMSLKSLWKRLPAELMAEEIDSFQLENPDLVASWLTAAEPILLSKLNPSEDAS